VSNSDTQTSSRRIRIGIDVGGTFTHSVAIDTATFDIVAKAKVPTTHSDSRGVAAGIVQSLHELLNNGVKPSEIVMIAHSTTQATNALLEGDVAKVGVIGMASGFGRSRARKQTAIGSIQLAPGRFLHTLHTFIDTTDGLTESEIRNAVDQLMGRGAEVIVASAAFSVEDTTTEMAVADYCRSHNILCTAACEISQLYGLRARTRTAVINASMLPKMLETANMTETSVRDANITAPLMIMRSDGGIMDIEQMRRRPILTMLSGPAAGVAAALMYARITDGIFLEVGGTSTDISAIRNGKSLVKSATVGGNRLYLRTLDVRTLGVAGGSTPRVNRSHVIDAGPRSAHIAHLGYAAFTEKPDGPIAVRTFQPLEGDPEDYVRMEAPGVKAFTLTPTCASNYLGLVAKGDNAESHSPTIEMAVTALTEFLGRPDEKEAVVNEMMTSCTKRVEQVVNDMIEDYELDPQLLTLTGGGGGASAIVAYTAKRMNLPYVVAPNSAVISAIGAALALVRDTIERTVINPTESDVIAIRRDAEEAVIRMGATPESVEVQIEIDPQKNILRASASGTTELRTRDLGKEALSEEQLMENVLHSVRGTVASCSRLNNAGSLAAFEVQTVGKRLGGLLKKINKQYRVIDREGIIRLQVRQGDCIHGSKDEVMTALPEFFDKHTIYGDAGKEFPSLFAIYRGKILDLSGLPSFEMVSSLLQIEMNAVAGDETVIFILKN